MAKLTTEEFIKRAKEVHGNKYDYSLVEYVNSSTKVKIICPKHGIFEQTPNKHLQKRGCPECAKEARANAQRMTLQEFVEKARKKHGNVYDYSKVNYINSQTKVIIICPEHGEFEQQPNNHLSGNGCPKCYEKHRGETQKHTTEIFITIARETHGDKYDYSNTVYKGANKKVHVICPEHGEFEQNAASHLAGCGCPKCNAPMADGTTEEFIKYAREIHGDKYDYSKVEYVSAKEKVCIICPEHGEFWQEPNNHLSGKQGCPKCGVESVRTKLTSTTEEFIAKAREKHGDKYDYSKVNYINNNTEVCIVCPEHGEFWQTPHSHLSGNGCQLCHESKLEREVRLYLTENNINFIHQYRDKEIFKKQSIDFYLLDLNIAIECQGIQHFQPTDFASKGDEWSKEMHEKVVKLDKDKQYLCDKNNIKLIYFTTEANKSYITEEQNTHYQNYQVITSLDDLLLSIQQQSI